MKITPIIKLTIDNPTYTVNPSEYPRYPNRLTNAPNKTVITSPPNTPSPLTQPVAPPIFDLEYLGTSLKVAALFTPTPMPSIISPATSLLQASELPPARLWTPFLDGHL